MGSNWDFQQPTLRDYHFIMDNLKKKLSGWKTNFLNIAGRKILVKTSLNRIPMHIMYYFKLPLGITKKIDKIQRNFVWGTTDVKRNEKK